MVRIIKQLIVNADDFGLHVQINDGIIKGYQQGFITSTSIMTSAPAYEHAKKLALENSGLGIGVHLTLVGGVKSVTAPNKLGALVDDKGLFWPDYAVFAKHFYSGKIKLAAIEAELRAQIERALQDSLPVTHIDSHQHTHVLPIINKLVIRLCNEYKIKCIRNPQESFFFSGGFNAGIGRKIGRNGLSFCAALGKINADRYGIKYPEHFFGMLAGGNLNETLAGNIIKALPDGVSEIMTHPGLCNDVLAKSYKWNYHWEDELNAFLSEKNKCLLKEHSVNLINFGGLI